MDAGDIQAWLGRGIVFVALIGAIIAWRHVRFLCNAPEELAKRLKYVFLTDLGIYFGSLLVGIWFFLEFRTPGEWLFVNFFQAGALVAQIWASLRLYRHYKVVSSGNP